MTQIFIMNRRTYLKSKKTVNKELKKVRKWLEANRLALNIEKNSFVLFHPPRYKFNAQITLKFGRKKISQETYITFLGVLLDSHLSWNSHKGLSDYYYKVRHYAPLETLKLLYHGIFHPFISYGVQVWDLIYNLIWIQFLFCKRKL